MKNLLFVTNTLGVGGAERALLELLDALDGKEYAVDLYVLLGRGEFVRRVPKYVRLLNRKMNSGSVQDSAGRRRMSCSVIASFFRNGAYADKLAGVLRAILPMLRRRRVQLDKLLWRVVSDGSVRPEKEYDVAVAWIEGGSAYFVADHVRARKKIAVIHIDYEQSGYTRALDRNCWAQFQRIFLVSGEIKEPFLRVYPEYRDRVQVLPNLVNQERIRRMAREPGGFTDGYSGMRLLSVGRLTYQKAFDISIDAMKLLKDNGCRARWYVLGEGIQREGLERKISALGLQEDFVLLGAVENPYPYYAQTDIYVHTTRFEGRSIAIQEAQTLGCAVVVSDVSGNRVQVAQDQDGLLCPLEAEAIAKSIEELLHDSARRRRLGQAAMAKQTAGRKAVIELLDF